MTKTAFVTVLAASMLICSANLALAQHTHGAATPDQGSISVATPAAITLGPLEISGAFTRATLPDAKSGGGFLTIVNTGGEADRLVSAASPVADMVQLHEMKMEGDVMKMSQVENGIDIAAGETVVLAPGGLHLMFMGLRQAFVEGSAIPVTLTFEKAGTIELELPVGAAAAAAPDPVQTHETTQLQMHEMTPEQMQEMTPEQMQEMMAGSMEHTMLPPAVTVGTLSLSGAYSRATLPEAKTAGGFFEITNNGPAADRLVAASSLAAAQAGVHEMVFENKVMKMRAIEGGLEIPAGATVSLVPGGVHIMFMGIKAPFVEGESVTVTLKFEKAGAVDLVLPIGDQHAGHDH